jgi:CarD family transcriptional regulator
MAQRKKAPAKAAKATSTKRDVRKTVERRSSPKPAEAAKRPARKPAAAVAAKAKPLPGKAAKQPEASKPAVAVKPTVAAKPAVAPKPVAAKAPAASKKAVETAVAKPAAVKPAVAKPVEAGHGKAAVAPADKVVAMAAAARPIVAPRAIPAALSKRSTATLTAPAAPKAATPKQVAEKAAAVRQQQLAAAAAAKKPVSQRHGFKTNEFIVYPAHGVGRIIGIEEQEIAGISLELFVIQFEKDKMTLRVPTGKSQSVGMRKLSDEGIVKRAMDTLKGKARIKRTMWSRRAQEYEAKINSGDLIAIAEVVRDLYRSETQPEQSYSERQLYEAALDRMAREIAAVDKLDERGAMQRITEVLSKSAKGRRAEEASAAEVKAA